MSNWWRRCSLKVRLIVWYSAVMAIVLAGFAFIVYETVEHRLEAELDRQLRIDFDLVEAQLQVLPDGAVRWLVRGAHGDEGYARLSAWFEVWSEDGRLLLRHWPVPDESVRSPLPAPIGTTLRFYESELEHDLHVRLMERPARVGDIGVIMRMFRDESDLRRTLRQIVEVFLLALPFAVLAASLGGYLMARRSLRPVARMAEQARHITSRSLSARLPNPNPTDEFGQLATVFNATLERLEKSFAELRRFTADASHELRTPLTALRAVGEVAVRDPDRGSLREAILSMLEEAQRLDALIESLLTMARLEGDQVPLRAEPVTLVELCRDVVDTLAVLAEERQQVLAVHDETGLTVITDRELLRRALLNIVHNAIRHAPDATPIDIRVTRHADDVVLSVTDRGTGIASDLHERIFERFFRADTARTRDGGYGLGLAIARRSIERLRGRIELESSLGKGSTFRIYLPVDRST